MALKKHETYEKAMMMQVTLLQPKVGSSDEALATLFKGVHGSTSKMSLICGMR